MKAKDLYPECQDGEYFWAPSDYTPIICSLGTVAIQVDDEDYQGDSRILYRDPATPNLVGYLQFGWGSCSGCDALQACKSYEDIDFLISQLESDIKWSTPEELLLFFKTHDWQGDYSWHSEEQQKFVGLVIAYLTDLCAQPPTSSSS